MSRGPNVYELMHNFLVVFFKVISLFK